MIPAGSPVMATLAACQAAGAANRPPLREHARGEGAARLRHVDGALREPHVDAETQLASGRHAPEHVESLVVALGQLEIRGPVDVGDGRRGQRQHDAEGQARRTATGRALSSPGRLIACSPSRRVRRSPCSVGEATGRTAPALQPPEPGSTRARPDRAPRRASAPPACHGRRPGPCACHTSSESGPCHCPAGNVAIPWANSVPNRAATSDGSASSMRAVSNVRSPRPWALPSAAERGQRGRHVAIETGTAPGRIEIHLLEGHRLAESRTPSAWAARYCARSASVGSAASESSLRTSTFCFTRLRMTWSSRSRPNATPSRYSTSSRTWLSMSARRSSSVGGRSPGRLELRLERGHLAGRHDDRRRSPADEGLTNPYPTNRAAPSTAKCRSGSRRTRAITACTRLAR